MAKKVDKVKMEKMLRAGRSQVEIARYFDVSTAAICKLAKTLRLDAIRSVTLESAHKVVARHLDTVSQLHKINQEAIRIIDGLSRSSKKADKELILKACREIRGQLDLQLDVFKTLYDWQAVRQFQQEVLTAIGQEAPHVRDRIVHRLKAASALRGSIRITF